MGLTMTFEAEVHITLPRVIRTFHVLDSSHVVQAMGTSSGRGRELDDHASARALACWNSVSSSTPC